MDEFNEVYKMIAGSRLVYVKIKRLAWGIPRWRLQVFEKDTAPHGGDRELLCVEHQNEEKCFQMAAKELRKRIDGFPIVIIHQQWAPGRRIEE